MPIPVLGATAPESAILERIGKIASEWAWVEMLLGEMLAHFCSADHGAMYVITHNVSVATQTDWLRTLTEIQVKDDATKKVILELLNRVDDARTERNTVVHGTWRAHAERGFAFVQTFRWDRQEVVRDELWSVADLDATAEDIASLQTMLTNLGIRMKFLHPKSEASRSLA